MRNRGIVVRTAVQRNEGTMRLLKRVLMNNTRSFRYWFEAHAGYYREWEGDGSRGSGSWSRLIVPED